MKLANYKIISLTYLNGNFGTEYSFWKEILDTALQTIPELLQILDVSLRQTDYHNLGETAHQLKGVIQVFGMENESLELKQLQLDTEKRIAVESYPTRVKSIINQINAGLEELKHLYKSI
jgi:HPt (histidine-containing phosphotransfer) domain-containing protein